VADPCFALITGKDDRLLRRLRIAIALKLPGAPHASVRFLPGVRRPNQPVRIAPGA
jgi:hypothetical protein